MTNKKFNHKPNKIYKTDNGHLWHSRSNVVVGHVHALVNNGLKDYLTDEDFYVLVGTRGTGKHKGFYNVPCGYLDWSETIENAMYREVYEEAGLYLPDWKHKFLYDTKNMPWFINSEPTVTLQNVLFHCGVLLDINNVEELPHIHLENMEPDECENIQWIKLSEVKTIVDKFCFNHHERILQFHENYTPLLRSKGLL